jgi:drug/metabolite transporter (DMT)-like permease
MVAFAANSVLCRAALGQSLIDASSFTVIRVLSGAATLWLIWTLSRSQRGNLSVDWGSALMLFLYAVTFSFAYITLETGTGALLLFGLVQLTMISVGLWQGERPNALAWAGLVVAIAGLVYLISPGLSAPSPHGAGLMGIAGIAWGIYSLRGKGAHEPMTATTGNFVGAVPMALIVGLFFLQDLNLNATGVMLATVSGALTSGVGYVIWYTALPGLTPTKAASVQLSVPAIAGLGGVLLLSEPLTIRLVVATVAILGGIAIVLSQRH